MHIDILHYLYFLITTLKNTLVITGDVGVDTLAELAFETPQESIKSHSLLVLGALAQTYHNFPVFFFFGCIHYLYQYFFNPAYTRNHNCIKDWMG